MDNIVEEFVEVKLKADFLVVKETLSRIGIASKKDRKLYQSCHILHKRQKYYILHFKELFKLDGKPSTITQEDISRRNTICNLLEKWGLVELVDFKKSSEPLAEINSIKIISNKEKKDWELIAKYSIGNKK
jgi:hypothetical protein